MERGGMKPLIHATILPLIAALACLISGCQTSPKQKAPLVLDGRIVGKWVETGHGGDLEIKADGTGRRAGAWIGHELS